MIKNLSLSDIFRSNDHILLTGPHGLLSSYSVEFI